MKYLTLLFCLGLSSLVFAGFDAPVDSTGYKKIDGKYYILHSVDKGQGLFGVARRYNTTVDVITKANPEVEKGLKVGQILRIPIDYDPTAKKETPKKEEPKKDHPKKDDTNPGGQGQGEEEGKEVIHVVKSGETLYRIATTYNMSVDEIKALNGLKNNNLEAGQKLIIKKGKKEHTENYGGNENPEKTEETTKPTETPNNNNFEYNKVTGEVKEGGLCMIAVDETLDQNRSFALHATAPLGTIIMVTNTVTNKSVFVRVVGRMEGSTPDGVVLKLTQAAADRLGLKAGETAQVKLNYSK